MNDPFDPFDFSEDKCQICNGTGEVNMSDVVAETKEVKEEVKEPNKDEPKEAKEYLGLSKKMAQDKCEGKNMIFRLISIDGDPYFSWPEDRRTDRICIEIVNGKVTLAKIM